MSTCAPEPAAQGGSGRAENPGVAVSLIVPLDGGPEQALRCFRSLAELPPEPEHEVVVVDDAAPDLRDLLDRLAGDVEVVRSPTRVGLAGAVALGAAAATGDVLVVLRGAPVVAPGFLAALVERLGDPAVAAAAAVTAGEETAHPAGTRALAVRSADLEALGARQPVPDALTFPALAMDLAGGGREVVAVRDSVVQAPGARMAGARRPLGEAPELTIVIPTLDATSDRTRRCLAAIAAGTDAPHEIVVVDNGAPPQGFTAPVNAGLRAARGRYAVVMNDDVEPLPGWWPPLREALDSGAAVAFPATIEGPTRHDFAAWCFAIGAEDLARYGCEPGEFFDPNLRVWFQDTDLLVRLRAEGRPPVEVPASRVRHGLSESVGTADPRLRAWIDERIAEDRAAFAAKHPEAVKAA